MEESEKTERRLTYNAEELVSNEGKCFLAYDLRNTNFAGTLIDAIKQEKRERGKEGRRERREGEKKGGKKKGKKEGMKKRRKEKKEKK